MSEAMSHSNNTLFISTTPQNSDLNLVAFAALTYIQVTGVGSVGEYGVSTNTLTYDTWDTLVAKKAKGITNAGDPEVEVARSASDPGQIAMTAAGHPSVKDSYAFKVVRQDGSVDYLRGLVAGPRRPNGRNEDFDLCIYTLMLNQLPVEGSVGGQTPAQLRFQTPIPGAASTSNFGPIRVEVRDAAGVLCTGDNTTSVVLAKGGGTAGAITVTSPVVAANGIATFNTITCATAGSLILLASSGALAPDASPVITIT